MLAREREIRRVVDFGPGKARRTGRAYHDSLVGQMLYRDVEEFVDPSPEINSLIDESGHPRRASRSHEQEHHQS
jgi:hypothetical protein